MTAELLVLRLVHILCGIIWVGSGIFSTFFLAPALGKAGPSVAGPVMGAMQQRRLFTIMPVIALLTLLSGFRLLQITSAGFSDAYMRSNMGRTFLWSGIAATLAFLIGLLIARPAGARAGRLGASLASLPEAERAAAGVELERLRRRSTLWTAIAMIFLIGAAAGMSVARYLG